MSTIKVFPFTYYDAEQDIRQEGSGMCTEETITRMREKDPIKDHRAVESRAIEIDSSELNQTGRYYIPANEKE